MVVIPESWFSCTSNSCSWEKLVLEAHVAGRGPVRELFASKRDVSAVKEPLLPQLVTSPPLSLLLLSCSIFSASNEPLTPQDAGSSPVRKLLERRIVFSAGNAPVIKRAPSESVSSCQ